MTPSLYVRGVKNTDMWQLSSTMREADRIEVRASGLCTPHRAIEESLENSSVAWVGVRCVEGVETVLSIGGISLHQQHPYGIVWSLTSEAVEKVPFGYFKLTRWFHENFIDPYAIRNGLHFLGNFVDERYQKSIGWLERLGYKRGNIVVSFSNLPFVLMCKEYLHVHD